MRQRKRIYIHMYIYASERVRVSDLKQGGCACLSERGSRCLSLCIYINIPNMYIRTKPLKCFFLSFFPPSYFLPLGFVLTVLHDCKNCKNYKKMQNCNLKMSCTQKSHTRMLLFSNVSVLLYSVIRMLNFSNSVTHAYIIFSNSI